MPQVDPNKSESLKEMLEKGAEVSPDDFAATPEDLKSKLQDKERELAKHKAELAKIKEGQEEEKVPEKEVVVERERTKEEPTEDEEEQKKIAEAKKVRVKQAVADDIAIIMDLDQPKQVKVLVWLALRKGVYHAFDVAKGLGSPYLLDEFHDVMVDEMRDLMVKKGKIKKLR
ncbi:hypothetical protein KKC60_01455 [Patescibacteria group bacterium]|nr:hypothetical protein [Patescibacteria group bacterium]